MKRTLLKTIIILFTFNACIGLFDSGEYRLPSIDDFNISTFNYFSTKPIYIYYRGRLYYSPNGEVKIKSKPIWYGQLSNAFPSPNAKYIAIYEHLEGKQEYKLTIINSNGECIKSISPFRSIYDTSSLKNFWRDDDIQWSRDSTKILLVKDKYPLLGSHNLFSNDASLYLYDTTQNKLTCCIRKPNFLSSEYYFSDDGNSIYYNKANGKGDLDICKYNIDTKYTIYHKSIIKPKDIFINFSKSDFGDSFTHFNYNQTCAIGYWGFSNKRGLYLYKNKKLFQIFKTKLGLTPKDPYSLAFENAFFLPGNQFLVFSISAKEYDGTIVLNTETKKYTIMNMDYEIYFNISSKDITHYKNDSGRFPERKYLFMPEEK